MRVIPDWGRRENGFLYKNSSYLRSLEEARLFVTSQPLWLSAAAGSPFMWQGIKCSTLHWLWYHSGGSFSRYRGSAQWCSVCPHSAHRGRSRQLKPIWLAALVLLFATQGWALLWTSVSFFVYTVFRVCFTKHLAYWANSNRTQQKRRVIIINNERISIQD